MKIYLGSDHAGFRLKEKVKRFLDKKNIEFEDLGNLNLERRDDYVDYAVKVSRKVVKEKSKGILICGSGQGMCIAANKIKGVRAVNVGNLKDAKKTREDNDANVLCLSGSGLSKDKVERIILTWLKTPFSNLSRHKRRIGKIKKLER